MLSFTFYIVRNFSTPKIRHGYCGGSGGGGGGVRIFEVERNFSYISKYAIAILEPITRTVQYAALPVYHFSQIFTRWLYCYSYF